MQKHRLEKTKSRILYEIIKNNWIPLAGYGGIIIINVIALIQNWGEILFSILLIFFTLIILLFGYFYLYKFLMLPKRPMETEYLIDFEMNYKPHSLSEKKIGISLLIKNHDWGAIRLIEANVNTMCDKKPIGKTKNWHKSHTSELEGINGIMMPKEISPSSWANIDLVYPTTEMEGDKFHHWEFTIDITIEGDTGTFTHEYYLDSKLWETKKINALLRFLEKSKVIENDNP